MGVDRSRLRAQHRPGDNEPALLATIARSKLALGMADEALAAAEEAVAIMDIRGLATCALTAPITLAQVLIATHGAGGGERIDTGLARAMRVVRRAAPASSNPRSVASSRRSRARAAPR